MCIDSIHIAVKTNACSIILIDLQHIESGSYKYIHQLIPTDGLYIINHTAYKMIFSDILENHDIGREGDGHSLDFQ